MILKVALVLSENAVPFSINFRDGNGNLIYHSYVSPR